MLLSKKYFAFKISGESGHLLAAWEVAHWSHATQVLSPDHSGTNNSGGKAERLRRKLYQKLVFHSAQLSLKVNMLFFGDTSQNRGTFKGVSAKKSTKHSNVDFWANWVPCFIECKTRHFVVKF